MLTCDRLQLGFLFAMTMTVLSVTMSRLWLVMEGRLSTIKIFIHLLFILEALFILFPLLTALVLHFLFAIEVSLLASVEALFVTVLFLHHGSICIVFSLLLLLLLTCLLITHIALLLLLESLALFILAFAFFLECSGKSLSLAVASSVRVERRVIIFLLLLDNSLSFLKLRLFPLSASLLVLSLFLSSQFAGFFFSSSI